MQNEVIIVGAGAAGLMAAQLLSAAGWQVQVLEARSRMGGRIHTMHDAGFAKPVEGGAEFIHGNLELTLHLLKASGIKTELSEGSIWRSRNGALFQQEDFIADGAVFMQALQRQQEEMSVGAFLDKYFSAPHYGDLKKSVADYVNGYYAGTLARASVLALKEEWLAEDEPQHRVQGGYEKLLQALYTDCRKNGVGFSFSTSVKKVTWAFEKVEVTTGNGQEFNAQKLVVTVPAALMQQPTSAHTIAFAPALSQHEAAFQKLGSGSVIKILIQFETAFWREDFHLSDLNFLFSSEAIPTWWTQHPQQDTLLTGWCAGPHADALLHETDNEIFQKALQSLAAIFNLPLKSLQEKVTAWRVCNWATDPFTMGGYSYTTTTTKEALQTLLQPVENTIYFAGEALYDDINVGTVEAALQSGKRAAAQVCNNLG